jgi:nucleotidyltransferase/DNA polymerase involved in DNA repair
MGPAFVEVLPVGKFHGVGPATTAKMNRLGIEPGLDLKAPWFIEDSVHSAVPTTFRSAFRGTQIVND